MSHTIITGSTTGFTPQSQTWQYPQRLEWHDFVNVPGNLTLLVLALQRFEAESEDRKLAYFQISGTSLRINLTKVYTECQMSLGTMAGPSLLMAIASMDVHRFNAWLT